MRDLDVEVPSNLNNLLSLLAAEDKGTFPLRLIVKGSCLLIETRRELFCLVQGLGLMWQILDERHPGVK